MEDVVRESCEARGPVDVVLSCLREFACPFFGGLEHYWSVLTLRRLHELYQSFMKGQLPSTTAGPQLVASLCKLANARNYLPYANGYEGVGVAISDIGWGSGEGSEAIAVEHVRRALSRIGAPTAAMEWITGDCASFVHGHMRVLPYQPVQST